MAKQREAIIAAGGTAYDDNGQPIVPEVKVASLLEPDKKNLTEDELRTMGQHEAIQKLIDKKPAEVAQLLKAWLSDE